MYRCELCGKTAPPHTPAHKVIVETRRVTYPLRPKVFACWKWQGDRRKFVRPDDPGGVGRQVAREVMACPDCARRATTEAAEDGRDAARARHTPPRVLLSGVAGRPPPRDRRSSKRGDEVLCKFTEETARGHQLLATLLHELGHHHDRMTTKNQARPARGESYAETYARQYAERIWISYQEVFGVF